MFHATLTLPNFKQQNTNFAGAASCTTTVVRGIIQWIEQKPCWIEACQVDHIDGQQQHIRGFLATLVSASTCHEYMVLAGWLVLSAQHAARKISMRPTWCTEITLTSQLRELMNLHRILDDQSPAFEVLTSHGEKPTDMLLPLSSARSSC